MIVPSSPQPPTLNGILRITQILVLALMMGMTIFAVFTTLTVTGALAPAGTPSQSSAPNAAANPNQLAMLGWISIAGTVGGAIIGWLFERSLDKQARTNQSSKASAEEREFTIAKVLQTQTILRAAIMDAFGLLGVMSVFLTGEWLGMTSFAIAIVVMAPLAATRSRFDALVRRLNSADPFEGLRK